MRWIYLSPHFDDAVLSCGGLIWDQAHRGTQVEIWTILAGNPQPGSLSAFALETHDSWGTAGGEQTVNLRKAEDLQAAALLDVKPVHFDYPDCIYRRSPKGEVLYPETVTAVCHPEDADLMKNIASSLEAALLEGDMLVCPLALGGHVDHLLVRQAAEFLRMPLLYYADVPYLLNDPKILEPAVSSLAGQLHPVSESGLAAWLRGVAAYRSQLDSLYKGTGTLYDAIRSYWARECGIRLWCLDWTTFKTA
jgi:hypothetical protein